MSHSERRREQEPLPEKGANVRIDLKIIRHGERTKEGLLTDYGRQVTRERARESGIKKEDYHAVKAYGSPAGPKGPSGMQRSLETAHIFADEIAGADVRRTRPRDLLSYETLKTPTPYDHREVYDAHLPSNFDTLSNGEKAEASHRAQEAVLNHILGLSSPEAQQYKKEAAGALATFLHQFERIAPRLRSGARVLLPSGSHGGVPLELFLQQALVREFDDGRRVIGFDTVGEIGGSIAPSESFTISVKTNNEGKQERLNVVFDNPKRPKCTAMYLDQKRLQELRVFYTALHPKDREKEEGS